MKKYDLNKEVLDQFYCGCNESMQEVFIEFLNRHSEIKTDITNSYISRSTPDLKRCFHSNGPSFMYLGLPEISLFFKKLELQCTPGINNPVSDAEYVTIMQMIDAAYQSVTIQSKLIERAVASPA
jgi:hypothetical protein